MTEEEGVVAVVASREEVEVAAMAVGAEVMVEGEGGAEEVLPLSLYQCITLFALLE